MRKSGESASDTGKGRGEDGRNSSPLEQVICFDTLGTTIDLDAVELNKILFNHAEELGYSRTEIARLRSLYENNRKDPAFLRESGRGKEEMVRRGLYQVKFFDDILEFLVKATERGLRLVTVSKGGIEFLKAIYETRLPEPVTIEKKTYERYIDFLEVLSTSVPEFKHQDKTAPACYMELVQNMYALGRQVLSYVSDDPKETAAAQGASEMLKEQAQYPELRAGIRVVLISPEEHRIEGRRFTTSYDKGIYLSNNLPGVVDISAG